jgi:superfamily II DNA/RNA helicase
MLRLAAWATGDVLERAGLRAVFFTGAESQRIRTQNIVDFHDDRSAAVMFLSDAGGVGLNLQRAASCCVNLEMPWNPAVLEQRIGRIYRLGQPQPIDVYNLVTEYGIEARIADLVGAKKALFDGLFDGTTDDVQFDGGKPTFLSQVQKLVPEVPDLSSAADESPAVDEAVVVDDLPVEMPDTDAEAASNGHTPSVARLPAAAPSAPPAVGDVAQLFASVRVTRSADGGLRIEAPASAAASLGALFETMAALLGQVAATPAAPTKDARS